MLQNVAIHTLFFIDLFIIEKVNIPFKLYDTYKNIIL